MPIEILAAEAKPILPEPFWFLGVGWWIVHLVGIPLVGFIGFLICRKKSHQQSRGTTPPETHQGG